MVTSFHLLNLLKHALFVRIFIDTFVSLVFLCFIVIAVAAAAVAVVVNDDLNSPYIGCEMSAGAVRFCFA